MAAGSAAGSAQKLSPETPVFHLPFSPSIRCDDLIFVSAHASADKTGRIISGVFEEEFQRSTQNMIPTKNYLSEPANGPTSQRLYAVT